MRKALELIKFFFFSVPLFLIIYTTAIIYFFIKDRQ